MIASRSGEVLNRRVKTGACSATTILVGQLVDALRARVVRERLDWLTRSLGGIFTPQGDDFSCRTPAVVTITASGCTIRALTTARTWLRISRDRGRLFHGIAGSHFAVTGRLINKLTESGLKAWVEGFRGFSARAFA